MRFKTQKEDFLTALSSVAGAVNPKATVPILSHILLQSDGQDSLKFTATDLELGIQTSAAAQIEEEGSVAIPAKKFHNIVRELPSGEVEVTVAKNFAVNIKTAKSFFKIMGLEPTDFPKFPEPAPELTFKLSQRLLKQCLALTVFATSRDEARYTLNGILFVVKKGNARFIATDGKRLASIEKESEGLPKNLELEAIVPVKATIELLKSLSEQDGEVEVVRAQNQIIFKLGTIAIASRLIEGKFPNYDQVIPTGEKTKTNIAREELLAAIKRVALLTSQESQSVKLDFIKGRLLVSSRAPNVGEAKEEIEVAVSGEDLTIGFNPGYLIDVLKNLDTDEISLSLTDPDKPGLIRSDEGYQYVVMPMQLT